LAPDLTDRQSRPRTPDVRRREESPLAEQSARTSGWPEILDVPLVLAVARLPARDSPDCPDGAAREALVRRVHREFEEMPGLPLTLVEATKLFGMSSDACARILRQLLEGSVLRLRSDGRYVLRTGQP
jgi:hypothetical protein